MKSIYTVGYISTLISSPVPVFYTPDYKIAVSVADNLAKHAVVANDAEVLDDLYSVYQHTLNELKAAPVLMYLSLKGKAAPNNIMHFHADYEKNAATLVFYPSSIFDDLEQVYFSICSDKDNFSRRQGVANAILADRLPLDIPAKDNYEDKLREVLILLESCEEDELYNKLRNVIEIIS